MLAYGIALLTLQAINMNIEVESWSSLHGITKLTFWAQKITAFKTLFVFQHTDYVRVVSRLPDGNSSLDTQTH